MVQAIQVLRFHLLELEKVSQSLNSFFSGWYWPTFKKRKKFVYVLEIPAQGIDIIYGVGFKSIYSKIIKENHLSRLRSASGD